MALSSSLGFPRMGGHRELKFALEAYWKGKSSLGSLLDQAARLREQAWLLQQAAGIDLIPVGDFSLYDHVLDTVVLTGAIPQRYRQVAWADAAELYFAMARGTSAHGGLPAMEMTKWFNTNYHYLVPEWEAGQVFSLQADKLLAEIDQAQQLGIKPKPVLLGPVSLVLLGKVKEASLQKEDVIHKLLPVYAELFQLLAERGIECVQLDEPVLSGELPTEAIEWLRRSCEALQAAAPSMCVILTSYFSGYGDHLQAICNLPVRALHLDLCTAPHELARVLELLPADKSLSLGLVNGRNVWGNDYARSVELIETARRAIGPERLIVASSCSLLHAPLDVGVEAEIDPEIRQWLAFAMQKLQEIALLTTAANRGVQAVQEVVSARRRLLESRATSPRVRSEVVQQRLAQLTPAMLSRESRFESRIDLQQAILKLPLFPTTTIGSFPQTEEVRKSRAAYRSGQLSEAEYQQFLAEQVAACVRWQEEWGLEVLVHGEFDRNDMVEYFGEQLNGYVSTGFGWVQSYGSRCVKPPIIFGDVSRKGPMTVDWARFAQSLTDKPIKGMLTGPVTILFWSFVRDDQPLAETCRQIALAIRDEVSDLEQAGVRVIQIDEPAIREGLPLKRSHWAGYLNWAVECFRLASSSVADSTQIHTHMCYSKFNDILDAIADLDADVISIETSRSQMELLDGFAEFNYPNAIGPGVYDIHSPRVPNRTEMLQLLRKASQVIPAERLWVNPDCGLKTRGWPETEAALRQMVEAARELRQELAAV